MDTSEFVKLTPETAAALIISQIRDRAFSEPLGQRRKPRWPFPGTVELWLPDEAESERHIFGTAINISADGIAVRCDEKPTIGTACAIAIHLAEATYHGRAVVRHVTQTSRDYILGVQFTFQE